MEGSGWRFARRLTQIPWAAIVPTRAGAFPPKRLNRSGEKAASAAKLHARAQIDAGGGDALLEKLALELG